MCKVGAVNLYAPCWLQYRWFGCKYCVLNYRVEHEWGLL